MLHVDVLILVWGQVGGTYFLSLHVQCCVVANCSGLLGLCNLVVATLHLSFIIPIERAFDGQFFGCGVYYGDNDCKCKYFSALFVGITNTGMGMVARWNDVKVVVEFIVVKNLMDK